MCAHIVINALGESFDAMEERIIAGVREIPNPDKVKVYTCRELGVTEIPPDTPLARVDYSGRAADTRFALKLNSFVASLNPPRQKLGQ